MASTRSDSSASLFAQSPGSPIPTSLSALQPPPRSSSMSKRKSGKGGRDPASSSFSSTSTAPAPTSAPVPATNASDIATDHKSNGHATALHNPPSASDSSKPTFGMRARSASLQKGAAVLKALARAPEDSGNNSVDDDADSGYADENGEANVGQVPGRNRDGSLEGHKESEKESGEEEDGLSEEAKHTGRVNREGLRRKGEQKEVEKLVGKKDKPLTPSTQSSKKKAKGKSWEIPRKLFHSSIGFLVLYLYLSHTDLSIIVRSLTIFLAIVITADVIRLNIPIFETIYEMALGFLMREAEKEKVNGVVWYLVGVITCLHFFPCDTACVAIMILSWADTSASVFGRLFGAKTPPLPSPPFATRKSTAGFMAAVIAGTLTAAAFWATPVATLGMRAEGLSIRDWHGNAILGTQIAPGLFGSGWTGFAWGFRPVQPEYFLAKASVRNARQAISSTSNFKSVRQSWLAAKHSAKLAATATPTSGAPTLPLPLLCVASGLVAGIAEGLELGGVDDNLSLPILSAMGIQSVIVMWGWFANLRSVQ